MRRPTPLEWLLLAATALLAAALQVWLWDWQVEDSAITFAYARHLAAGEGLVAYPGGERVEGFSNPLWTLWLAAFELVGVEAMEAARWSALGLGAATILATWAAGRHLFEDEDPVPPALAAMLVGGSAQLAIWNAGGLENPLFTALLAVGLWRLAAESKAARPGFPWSAAAFSGLALTRPEGALYGAAIGAWLLATRWRAGWRPLAAWAAVLAGPVLAYEAFRLAYFAWPLPNTYYAKLDDKHYSAWTWSGRGWRYLREWSHSSGAGFQLPALLAGAVAGGRRWATWGLLLAIAAVALWLPTPDAWDLGGWPDPDLPEWWPTARVAALGLVALAGIALAAGREGGAVRGPAALTAVVGFWFILYSNGDWMRGWRWVGLVTPAIALLWAGGLVDLARAVAPARRRGWAGAALGAAGFAALAHASVEQLVRFDEKPVTSHRSVLQRVRYNNRVQRLLHLDRVTNFEVDMGATMLWSGDDLLDIAGLNDVPVARHHYDRKFLTEYIFREHRPELMHTHGSWARKLGVRRIPAWREGWVELPGYSSKGYGRGHDGCMVRKDLFVSDSWDGPAGREVRFEGEVALVGFKLPTRAASAERRLTIELAMQAAPRSRAERFQVYGFLANEAALKVWELPVGYFWYPPESWAEGEIVVTKLAPELGGLPPGRYDLGLFVATREDVLLPREAPEGAVVPARGEAPARVSLGEVVWPDAVRVLPDAEALSRVDAHLDEVDAHADAGECGKAEAEWRKARAYRPMDEPWLGASFPRVERAMGRCHVARARAADTDAERIRALIRARDWDHHNRDQRALAAPLAEARHAEGLRARAEGDWEAAYRAFSDAVALDARRSWSRRRAEEARAHRLGLSE